MKRFFSIIGNLLAIVSTTLFWIFIYRFYHGENAEAISLVNTKIVTASVAIVFSLFSVGSENRSMNVITVLNVLVMIAQIAITLCIIN